MKKNSIASHVVMLTAALSAVVSPFRLQATPYASCITNNATTVGFRLNESGGNVTVTYEDGTTNAGYDGITTGTNLLKGAYTFNLSGHNGFAIAVTKTGNGVPSQISADTNAFAIWNSPRGVTVNQNPKIGSLFGRIYVDNSATGSQAKGIFALNSDLSLASSNTAVATGTGVFGISGSTSSPWRIRVAPDGTLVVGDFATATAALWQFSPDLSSSNLFLGTVGQTAAAANGIHGDMFGTARVSGSLAAGNLVLWIADSGMAVPSVATNPAIVLGPGTSRGMYNNIFRYDIGAGPLPWTNGPNYAFNLGLDVIPELVVESDIAPDGKVFAAFGRANLSNPNVTVLDASGANILWTSWIDTGGNGDPWRGDSINNQNNYPYAGVRVSPDDKYFATMGLQNAFLITKLTNGIPDANTLFGITNLVATGNARGMDWDIADNIYGVSSGQGLMRIYSLGLTATCITSNDVTGTNGTFVFITPPATATAIATTPNASQNYGTPTPGVITISLTTNVLTAPTTVAFSRSGTAVYLTNYTINLGANADNVVITPTNVVFPAGTYPHPGNWSADVLITPTAIPLSGPTTTATFTLLGGANYAVGGSTAKATVNIINTGPQLLTLSLLSSGSTMSRAVTNDYVTFQITRFGDTSVASYTVTNINYQGTAAFPADYTAQAQRLIPNSLLTDGSPGIVINPGEVFVTAAIGNPLMRANLNVPPANVSIVLTQTNAVTGTNVTSLEGYNYVVTTNVITLTELDNTYGSRVVLWSNPLTNSVDSTNWTLTYASQNLGTNTVLPVVIPNYTNLQSSLYNGGTNDFDVEFGYPLPSGVPASPAMVANGWTSVLKMTVNKSQGAPSGVNLYPQGQKFNGNYALRFSMYLSIWTPAVGNIYAGVIPREYATFGINHTGTNCNWRPSRTAPAGTSGTTNADGIWFAIDAADNAATPADFDAFTSPALPNSGVVADFQSNTGSSQRGLFKNPPFVNTQNPLGGEPVDQWVDVSVEVTKQTNCTIYINGAPVLPSFSIGATNATTINKFPPGTNGTVMLGYLDPDASIGDPGSQFVLYSNIRAVELSPYITAHPVSLIVTQGASVSFTSAATFATAPITNIWNLSSTNPPGLVLALQTNTANATNLSSTLSVANVQVGTNYAAVFSDLAGSVTGAVASLTVIISPTNRTVFAGSNVQFVVNFNGPQAPTVYAWRTNGVTITNSLKYAGVTTSTLTITNASTADAGIVYSVAVTNAAGGLITVPATLTVINTNALLANLVLSSGALTPAFASGTTSYAATNAYVNNPVTVTATSPVGTNATLQLSLNGGSLIPLTNGAASLPQSLRLSPPTNSISVKVTAQDAVTIQTYTVNVRLLPSQTVPVLTNAYNGSTLQFDWAADHIGYRLLSQTNPLSVGLGNNWVPVANADSTNRVFIPVVPANPSVFYKLIYP
jgi:hypothetical protein